MDLNTYIDKMPEEEIVNNISADLVNNSLTKLDEKDQIYIPPFESHTVNTNEDKSLLIIYGGMAGKDYNIHIFTFDLQTKKAKNLTYIKNKIDLIKFNKY